MPLMHGNRLTPTNQRETQVPAHLIRSQLLGAQQVAALLNMSVVHVRRLAKAGKLPMACTVGGRKLCWRASDIEALLNNISSK
jgi:excisionase family DNA binding protein